MTLDRIIGGIAVLFGGFLLLYAIPTNVRIIDRPVPYPAMFPQMAAWMFIGLGVVQMFTGNAEFEFPQGRQFLAFLGIVLLTLFAVLNIERLGYLVVTIPLMAAIALVSRERRPLWMATTVIGLPIGVWLLFEQILQRQLP